MGFTVNQKRDPNGDANADSTASVVDKIRKAVVSTMKNDLYRIDLKRQSGTAGYVTFQDIDIIPDDDDPLDPEVLADVIFKRICEDVEERGAWHYSVVFIRQAKASGKEVELTTCKVSQSALKNIGPAGEEVGTMKGEVAAMVRETRLMMKDTHNAHMATLGKLPALVDVSSKSVVALSEATKAQRGGSMEETLAVLEYMQRADERGSADRRYMHRKSAQAEMLNNFVSQFGPDFVTMINDLLGTKIKKPKPPQAPSDEPAQAPKAGKKSRQKTGAEYDQERSDKKREGLVNAVVHEHVSEMTQRLNDIIGDLDDDTEAALRDDFGDDLWSLMSAARSSNTDDVFRARIQELLRRVQQAGEAKAEAFGQSLLTHLGPMRAISIRTLFSEIGVE